MLLLITILHKNVLPQFIKKTIASKQDKYLSSKKLLLQLSCVIQTVHTSN